MADTIFGKILRGEIPCHKVYEDDKVLAFLDVGPLSRGHTLVIPKEPAETLDALSDESAAAIGRVLPRICRAVVRATGTQARAMSAAGTIAVGIWMNRTASDCGSASNASSAAT